MSRSRVVLGERQFRALIAGRSILVHNQQHDVELSLVEIQWMPTVRGIVDLIPSAPPDPPEAREFLPRRNRK